MAPHEHLFKRMNLRPETHSAAVALLITVQARTGPGSGYNLGPHSTGLPALCAYVASQQLRNNDLSEKVAQQSSCLKPKDFVKTLGIVRTVLSAEEPDRAIPQSPTKRRRTSSPSKEKPRSSPRKASAIDVTRSAPDDNNEIIPVSKIPISDHVSPAIHLPSPSTPRQSRGVSHPAPRIPMELDQSLAGSDEDEPELEHPPRRRFRPVFLDRTQWYARDPRLDRVWKNAKAHSEAMVNLYGHPFDRYRPRDDGTHG